METKLCSFDRIRGLVHMVVGGWWGEISDNFHVLLQQMAKARKGKINSQMGRKFTKQKSDKQLLASIVSRTRQQLSAQLLLDRLEVLGGGA